MTTAVTTDSPTHSLILSTEEWLKAEFSLAETVPLIGSREIPLVRPLTKNLIQAPEKAFKTTFLMRLALGLATGETVFSTLPIISPQRVLYLHGELAPAELKERLQEAAVGLQRPLGNFFQGRSLGANLVTPEGQREIRQLVQQYKPQVLVIDPWQSFIAGADENSFKDVSGATAFLDHLIAEFQLTVFLVVHLGKNHQRGARGHSLLAGWRDTKFTLRRDEGKVTVNVEPRWTIAPAPLKLIFHRGTLSEPNASMWTEQAKSIRSLVMVMEGKASREDVGYHLCLRGSALRMALKRAQDSGAIEINGDEITLPTQPSPNHPF